MVNFETTKNWIEKNPLILSLIVGILIGVMMYNPGNIINLGQGNILRSWWGPGSENQMYVAKGNTILLPCYNPTTNWADDSKCPKDYCYYLSGAGGGTYSNWLHHSSFYCSYNPAYANDANHGFYCSSGSSELCPITSPCLGEGSGQTCKVPLQPACTPYEKKCCKDLPLNAPRAEGMADLRLNYAEWTCECASHGTYWNPKFKCDYGCDSSTKACTTVGECSIGMEKCTNFANGQGCIQYCWADVATGKTYWTPCGLSQFVFTNKLYSIMQIFGQNPQTVTCFYGCSNPGAHTQGQSTCNPVCSKEYFGKYYCRGTDVWLCSSDGGVAWLSDQCGTNEVCIPYNSQCQPKPVPQACTPGSVKCDGNYVSKCRVDGSGYDSTTFCSEGCSNGICLLRKVCEPGKSYCQSNDKYVCNVDGTQGSYIETCSGSCSNGVCLQPAVCAPLVEMRCQNNKLEKCNPTGTSFEVYDDCAIRGELCVIDSCKQVSCLDDTDCDDQNENTIDYCANKGSIDAYCYHEPVTTEFEGYEPPITPPVQPPYVGPQPLPESYTLVGLIIVVGILIIVGTSFFILKMSKK